MTLFHIDDFEGLVKELPDPIPWTVVGVMPTSDDFQQLGQIALGPTHCFAYTVSDGPTEVWCPMASIEGRVAPPDVIAHVVNTIFTAYTAHQLVDGDNLIVPLVYTDDDGVTQADAVFWVGATVEDPDREQFRCYHSPHTSILPIRWSSPEGWPE